MKIKDERRGVAKENLGAFLERTINPDKDGLKITSAPASLIDSWKIRETHSQIAEEMPTVIGVLPAGNPNKIILFGGYYLEFFRKLVRKYEREVKPYDEITLIVKDSSAGPIPEKIPCD
jgi:hypothetical protein